MTAGSRSVAIRRRRPPHWAHASTSMPNARCTRAAQALLNTARRRRGCRRQGALLFWRPVPLGPPAKPQVRHGCPTPPGHLGAVPARKAGGRWHDVQVGRSAFAVGNLRRESVGRGPQAILGGRLESLPSLKGRGLRGEAVRKGALEDRRALYAGRAFGSGWFRSPTSPQTGRSTWRQVTLWLRASSFASGDVLKP